MHTWIILLRGINVGGRNRIKMDELKAILRSLKLKNIRTYIQSGNVVAESENLLPQDFDTKIAHAIAEEKGFEPQVMIRSVEEFQQALEGNPYPEVTSDDRRLHCYFLDQEPDQFDQAALEEAQKSSEQWTLDGRLFYLHAPDGIGRSKLVSNLERYLGVSATGRNWRTIQQIAAMAGLGE